MAEVAPGMVLVPFFHWNAMGRLPVVVTVNLALLPAATRTLAGCVVIPGGVPTLMAAAVLVAEPKPLVAVTEKMAPLSEGVVEGMV